jgi:photosystem II stability/assembly factor-like uncharacterized protein
VRSFLIAGQVIAKASASLGALALVLLAPELARGNGAFPAASQLVADPADADHVVLRTTFGLLVTRDRGANWDWLCEAGAGYVDVEPPMAVLPGGVILLAVPGGVSRSDATGCDFELAEGLDALVYDLARVPSEPDGAVAISAAGTDAQLWRSADSGKSFAPVGDIIPDFIPATVDVAATDANVIYASGLSGTTGALVRSTDGGRSFLRFPVPGTDPARRPYIAAVDPRNADTVYVRLAGQGASPLQVTHDGGESFVTVLTTTVPALGFAISPDGKTVIASNAYDGTFRANTDTLEFEKIACGGPICLSFSDAGLLGCGDQFVHGFVVGRSDDRGASFERLVDLTCVRGPVTCDKGTSVGSLCPAAWPDVQSQLGATDCSPPDVEPYTGCLGGAGAGEAGTTGGTAAAGGASTGGGASGGAGLTGGKSSSDEESSGACSCRVAARDSTWGVTVMAVLALRFHGRRRGAARRAA